MLTATEAQKTRLLFMVFTALASCLLAGHDGQAAPVTHRITFLADSISQTPFGLTSLPAPISSRFVIDDSILQPGETKLIDALPGFSLIDPIVIGDATFINADIAVPPGGRVVDGALVEIFFLAQFVDPVEGQRRFETYFFPSFQWTGTDFNPEPPSEFVFGSYTITVVPEPSVALLSGFGLGLFALRCLSILHARKKGSAFWLA